MLASVIIDEVAGMLNDADHVRWPIPVLLNFLTEAISAVAQGKPSVFVIVETLLLASGSTQHLSDQYNRLLDIHFNVNRDGSEGPNVLPGVYNLQQAFPKPGCSSNALVQTYAAYPGSERFFWVDPPVPRNLGYIPKVQALVMLAPQAVMDVTQNLYMPGSSPQLYQGALADWVLYRAYATDQESQTSWERSQSHLREFQTYMGTAADAPAQQRKSSGPPPAQTQRRAA